MTSIIVVVKLERISGSYLLELLYYPVLRWQAANESPATVLDHKPLLNYTITQTWTARNACAQGAVIYFCRNQFGE